MIFSGFGKVLGKIFEYGAVHEALKGAGEITREHARVVFDDAFRADFGHALRLLAVRNRPAAEQLTARLRRATETGEPAGENAVVRALARLLPRDPADKTKLDEDAALEVLAAVAAMPDELFAALINAMEHNIIAQNVQLFMRRHGAKALAAFHFTDAAADRLATALEPHANRLRARAAKKGIAAWLDF